MYKWRSVCIIWNSETTTQLLVSTRHLDDSIRAFTPTMSRFKNSLKRAYKRIFSRRRTTQPLPADFISPSSPLPSFPQHYTPRDRSATSYSSTHPSDTPSTGSVSNPESYSYTPDDGTNVTSGSTHPPTHPFARSPGLHSTPEDRNVNHGAPLTIPVMRPEYQHTSNGGSVNTSGIPQADTLPSRPVNSGARYHIPPLPEVPSFNRDSNGVITPVVPLTPLEQVEALNRAVEGFELGHINLQLTTNGTTGATLRISAANPNGNNGAIAAITAFHAVRNTFYLIAQLFKHIHIQLDDNLDTPQLKTFSEWLKINRHLTSSPIEFGIESLTWIGSQHFFDGISTYNMKKLQHLKMKFPQSIGQDRLKEILIQSPNLLTLDVDGVHDLTRHERRNLGNLAKSHPQAHYRTETSLEELTIASSGAVDAFLETLWLRRLQKFHFQVLPSPSSTRSPVSGILRQISHASVHMRRDGNELGGDPHVSPDRHRLSSRPKIEITYRGDGKDKSIESMIQKDVRDHTHTGMDPDLSFNYDSKVAIILKAW